MRDELSRRRPPGGSDPVDQPPTRALAELRATALLAQARILAPRVDVEMCARVAGIALVGLADLGTQDAVLSIVQGIVSVLLNETQAATRQRFSLAHEIGHWVLERRPVTHELRPIAARGRAYNEVEGICNYFAASLLMPRPWVRAQLDAGRVNTAELARIFDVSIGAMSARLRELGLLRMRRP